MSLGLIATGAAIVKTIQLQDLSARSDYTYETVALMIWFTTEMYIIIIAACIPTLLPLLLLLHGRCPSRKSASRSRETYSCARGRAKQGYHAHEDDHAHYLQIMPPPPSYRSPHLSADGYIGKQFGGKMQRGHDVEDAPRPDANDHRGQCELSKSSSYGHAISFVNGEATVHAERDVYSTLS